jgi:hypothetical protein
MDKNFERAERFAMTLEDNENQQRTKEARNIESGRKARNAMQRQEIECRAASYYMELSALRLRIQSAEESVELLQNELRVANDLTLIELHVESATIIQGHWRGYIGRKVAASMSEEQKLHAMETL